MLRDLFDGLLLITLGTKEERAKRLPARRVEISQCLLLATGAAGYGPVLMRASRKRWMPRVYEFQDLAMPGSKNGRPIVVSSCALRTAAI